MSVSKSVTSAVCGRLVGRGLLTPDDPVTVYLPELAGTSQEIRDYADQLGTPSCGQVAPYESRNWFDVPDSCRSFAFLPLRTSHTFGLLGLASDDPQRFFAGMGTVYLTRLGELTSVATARYLPLV